jgi:hypothetical protein
MFNCEKYLSHCDIATVIKKNHSESKSDATLTGTFYFSRIYGESHVYCTLSEYHSNP